MFHPTLARLRARRAAEDRGFTLIELLVVVVIIGILVGIAIPLYLNYRKGAANKTAESDVRGAISAVEQYYSTNSNAYPTSATGTGPTAITLGGTGNDKITLSDGNTLGYVNKTTSYVICAQNATGQAIYLYDSSQGGPVAEQTGKTTMTASTCAVS